MVWVKLVTLTVAPDTIATLLRERFGVLPAMSHEPSKTALVPSLLSARNHVAVPVAAAVALVIALKVITPATVAGAAVALKRSSASNVCAPTAVSAVAA